MNLRGTTAHAVPQNGRRARVWRAGCAGIAVAVAAAMAMAALPGSEAEAESTRSLTFKQMHTGETTTITFKRNGRFDPAALKQANYILRDWRRNETTKMDPRLLDLVWEVKQATGSTAPIHVLSGYRSPVTNNMLRRRSRGVAKNSQHTLGKAMDFYLPDVPLAKLRATAMRMQRGGVGYYPTSGSPFVHLDVARVRAWPRMTRKQLIALFPNGETLHLPADGGPLPGYQRALAKAKKGQLGTTAYASASPGSDDDDDDGRTVMGSIRDMASAITIGGGNSRSNRNSEPSSATEQVASADTESWTPPSTVPMPRTKPGAGTQLALAGSVPLPPLRHGMSDDDAAPLTTASIPMPRRRPLISDGMGSGSRIADMIARDNGQLTALARSTPGDDFTANPLSGPEARQQLASALARRANEMSSERTIRELSSGSSVFSGNSFAMMAHPTRDDAIAIMSLHQAVVTASFAGPVVVHAKPGTFSGPAIVAVSARHVDGPAPVNTASLRQ